MKKLVLLATAAAVLASVPATGSAANIKSILNRSQTVTYQGVKLPEGVTMYQNNPKALFAGEGKQDVKSVLLEAGVSSADVYTLNIKTENEMRYAVYANVVLGKQLSGRMSEAKHMNTDSSSIGALAAAINKGESPALGTFTVINPLVKQGNAYEGTLKYKSVANNNSCLLYTSFLQYVGVFISSFYGFLIFGESLSIATVGAGIAMFISSVMLARLKEQSGPLREDKVIEDKIK